MPASLTRQNLFSLEIIKSGFTAVIAVAVETKANFDDIGPYALVMRFGKLAATPFPCLATGKKP